MSLLKRAVTWPFRKAWAAFLRSQSEVPQDYRYLILGEYRGHEVRLVPVLAKDGKTVERWVEDPKECEAVDKKIEEEEKRRNAVKNGGPQIQVQTAGGVNLNDCGL